MRALLDTHVLVEYALGTFGARSGELDASARWVSPASAAEIGCLTRIGRLTLYRPPDVWFDEAVRAMGATLAAAGPGLLARSQAFPWGHRDPFDRILVQTLREDPDLLLYTRDAKILAYAAAEGLAVRDCR